jgi:hypothetical protein
MGMNHITRRCAAWIACLALLFAALAPAISKAMARQSGQVWTEMCSASGTRMVKIDLGQNDAADLGAHPSSHFEHCPFCANDSAPLALPPGASLTLPLLETEERRPPLFFQSAHPLPIWTSAQSRAPPYPA